MTRKQWAALTLSLLALGIGGTIAAVSIIDPFEVYHKATAFIPPITNGTQLYSNAGIAKNYAYDSVVIGSSMTENFRPSQLNRLVGGQFVKPFDPGQFVAMRVDQRDAFVGSANREGAHRQRLLLLAVAAGENEAPESVAV